MLRRFAWGSCGGSITGLQNFLKDSLTLFKVSGALQHWLLPFFLAMAAASAFLGLLMLTACMKRYDATYSAASFVGSFVVSASIMSAVHYDTFSSLENAVDFFLYPTGLLILMVGVYMLVRESEAADELLFIENDGDEQIVPVRKNTDDSSQVSRGSLVWAFQDERTALLRSNHVSLSSMVAALHVHKSRRRGTNESRSCGINSLTLDFYH